MMLRGTNMKKNTTNNFIMSDKTVIADKTLTPAAKLVYFVMADQYHFYLKNKGKYSPSQGDLAKYVGLSPNGVKKCLGQLVELGYIVEVSKKNNCSTVFHVNMMKDGELIKVEPIITPTIQRLLDSDLVKAVSAKSVGSKSQAPIQDVEESTEIGESVPSESHESTEEITEENKPVVSEEVLFTIGKIIESASKQDVRGVRFIEDKAVMILPTSYKQYNGAKTFLEKNDVKVMTALDYRDMYGK